MKKFILSLGLLAMTATATYAQDKAAATQQDIKTMDFVEEVHDFGTIPQGKPVTNEFKFKNTGNEPIVIQNVRASCGCTTPAWTKEPVLPGKTGMVKATYNAAAAAPFTKTITITSNVGTKTLTIKGAVEKAPESSVPQNSSMIKTSH